MPPLTLGAPGNGDTPQNLPSFEVATIKPTDPSGSVAGFWTYPGGRIVARHLSLRMLMMFALNVPPSEITGGPRWMDTSWYDVEAKPPASSTAAKANPSDPNLPPGDEQRQMLLALLIDRFQLKFHRDIRSMQIYFLDKGKGELKLRSPKDPTAAPRVSGAISSGSFELNGLSGRNASMHDVAATLGRWLRRPVVDRTGVEGTHDFDFETGQTDTEAQSGLSDALFVSILHALKSIGLNLTAATSAGDVVVIDSVGAPSAN